MNDNKSKIEKFSDLKVWQEAHKLVINMYKLTKSFPKDEDFGLTSQIRRASVSITSNIAEGFGRRGKEKTQFYNFSIGSLYEVQNQLMICKDVGYITEGQWIEFENQIIIVGKMLHGFIRSTKNYLFTNS